MGKYFSKVLILIFLILSNIFISSASDINSITTTWNKSVDSANRLAILWIITDNSTNISLYNLNKTITRREMLKVMMNLSWKNIWEECNWIFKDLKTNDWWCKYAESAIAFKFISQNDYFRPNDNISKIEAVKMIFQAKGITPNNTDDWREWYITKWVELGLFKSFNDFDTKVIRGWIFDLADNTIKNIDEKEKIDLSEFLITLNNDEGFKCWENINIKWYHYNTKLLEDGKCWTSTPMKHVPLLWWSYCYDKDEKNCDKYWSLYNLEWAVSACVMLWNWWKLPTLSNWKNLIDNGATGWTWNKIFWIWNTLWGTALTDWTFWAINEFWFYRIASDNSEVISLNWYLDYLSTLEWNLLQWYSVICINDK